MKLRHLLSLSILSCMPALAQVASVDAPPQPTLKQLALRDGNACQHVINDWVYDDRPLENATTYSSVIAVGTLKVTGTRFGSDENNVWTDYSFLVSQAIKGHIDTGLTLRVEIMGGQIQVESATAETIVDGFPKVIEGGTYLLFLSASDEESGAYTTFNNPTHIYSISTDGHAVCDDELRLCGRPLAEVVARVKQQLHGSSIR